MSRKELKHYMMTKSHCSAMVKITDDLTDILTGHSTWFSFAFML